MLAGRSSFGGKLYEKEQLGGIWYFNCCFYYLGSHLLDIFWYKEFIMIFFIAEYPGIMYDCHE